MQCSRCQAENRDGARFCRECGATFGTVCSSCGAKIDAGSRFCDGCGASLVAPPAPGAAGPSRFRSPETYTPKHLAERILTSKAALEGERKQVTVLFADLKGSMELLADRDPEEARTILDPVLEHMMEAVHRYEGTVNQVMGDGIMALFGAPLAHEDHAVRACYAALRMQESVKRYADSVRRAEGVPIRIRVGLNSGEVVVRAIGSDLHMDYTAVGQTTHLAARMEQLADPGSTLLTPETLALAEGYIGIRSIGPTLVKGLAEPIEVYEMLGASTVRSRFAAAAARGLTKFVGRAGELEQLSQALDRAKAGRGQVIAVVGEPGVGKSRLYYEFTHSHRVQDCRVIESVSVSYGKATAYLPVIELLRSYFRIEGRDDARVIREKVTGGLLSLDRALEPFMPALLWLLDVPTDDAEWPRLDPPQRRQQTLDGVKRLLLRESQVQPVIVIFEDLHWIDADTQALVDALVESLPAARIQLLVNYRPEYQHAWGSKTYYRQVRIDALPAASAHELLDTLLGPDPSVQALKSLLIKRAEGTPFFLEESVRTLVETKVLAGERGSYRLQKAVSTIEVPATVKALLAARIDRLESAEKAVLQAASVIGTDVPFELLHAIAEVPDADLRHHLVQLQSAEFLYETNLFPELEHTFKHALTHEVAYGTLLGDRRRALHARIVDAIERLHPDRVGEQVEQLAHHAVRGETWDRAVTYLYEAGTKAFKRSSNAEAIAYFRQGLELIERLPPGAERKQKELRFLLAVGPAVQVTRGFGVAEVESTYVRARELCEELEAPPSELFQALWGLWLFTGAGRGGFERARPIAEKLLAVADGLNDPALRLEAHHALCATTFYIGEPQASREHGDQGMALYDRERHRSLAFLYGGHDPGVCCRMHSGLALWHLGYPERALERSCGGLALARDLSHPHSLANALPMIGVLHQLRGDLEGGREVATALISLSTEHGFQQWVPFGRVLDAWFRTLQGGGDAAIEQVRQDIDEHRASSTLFAAFLSGLLAAMQLRCRQPAEGLGTVVVGLERAERIGSWFYVPELHRLRGELLLAGDPNAGAEAEAAFRQAIDVAGRQSAKSWELRAAMSLARLLSRRGDREEARRTLAQVLGWFVEGFDTADLRDAERLLDELSTGSA